MADRNRGAFYASVEEYVEARGGNRVIKKVSTTAFSQFHAAMRDAVSVHRQSLRVTSGRSLCDWYVTAAARGLKVIFLVFRFFLSCSSDARDSQAVHALARPYLSRESMNDVRNSIKSPCNALHLRVVLFETRSAL